MLTLESLGSKVSSGPSTTVSLSSASLGRGERLS